MARTSMMAKLAKKPKFKILDAQKGEKVLIRRGRAASNVTFTYNPARRAVMVDPDGRGSAKPFVFIQLTGVGLEVGVSS